MRQFYLNWPGDVQRSSPPRLPIRVPLALFGGIALRDRVLRRLRSGLGLLLGLSLDPVQLTEREGHHRVQMSAHQWVVMIDPDVERDGVAVDSDDLYLDPGSF